MDSNSDGVISSSDDDWNSLKVWVDANGDGVSQNGEVKSLESLGIVQFNLTATTSNTAENGNIVEQLSSYVTADGATHELASVGFLSAPSSTSTLQGSVQNMVQAMSSYTSGSGAATTTSLPVGSTSTSSGQLAAVSTSSTSVVASLLNQYDANGNVLTTTSQTNTAAATTLNTTTTLLDQTANGILVSGK
jgi:hypothetical protein